MAWKCEVCLINNDELLNDGSKRIDCEACESARVGFEEEVAALKQLSGSGEPANNPFRIIPNLPFGAPNTPLTANVTNTNNGQGIVKNTISFGAPSATAPISFGAPSATAPISFGAPSATAPISFGAPSATAPISFGAPSATAPISFGAPSKSSINLDAYKSKLPLLDHGNVHIGHVYTWGNGECDQLPFDDDDLNDDGVLESPTKVDMPTDAICSQVAAGSLHSVVLTTTGMVMTWGCDDDGAVGRKVDSTQERQCGVLKDPSGKELRDAVGICAGNSHGCLLKRDGSVFVWGRFKNSKGISAALRDDCLPEKVVLPYPCVKIDSGGDHMMAMCVDERDVKRVFVIGSNEDGQKGIGGPDPEEEESRLKKGLEAKEIEFDDCPGAIHDMFCGGGSSMLKVKDTNIDNSYRYFSVGRNGTGECGVGDRENNIITSWTEIVTLRNQDIKSVYCGDYHSLALTRQGQMYAWGHPEYLGCKIEGRTAIYEPKLIDIKGVDEISVGGRTNYFLTSNSLFGCGSSQQNQLLEDLDDPVPEFRSLVHPFLDGTVVQVGAGSQHVLALIGNGDYMLQPEVTIRRGMKRAKPTFLSDEPSGLLPETKISREMQTKAPAKRRITRVRERTKMFSYVKAGGDPVYLRV